MSTQTPITPTIPETVAAPDGAAATKNPYVGPRTFTQQQAHLFFGREREARELLALVIAERLVLFYAQSGAGKSSLLQTRLIPQLKEKAHYLTLPVGRVGGELPTGVTKVANIYLFNLYVKLNQQTDDLTAFAHMNLTDFMAGLRTPDGEHYFYDPAVAQRAAARKASGQLPGPQPPHVLIIDQFEEIITTHPTRWAERAEFFRQLNDAMQNDPYLWVVVTLREDFVAALDPYAHLVPGNMRTRYYMQRMGVEAALEAVQKPAEEASRPFAPGVAEQLVDNLRQIRVPGREEPQKDQYVEPVQLQVVCYQLWENLKDRPPGPITAADLPLGYIDQALSQFYTVALDKTLQDPGVQTAGVSERFLRNWFSTALITQARTRGTVYRDDESGRTANLPNAAIDLLTQQFLLRAELRAGSTWIELVHDRFIEPIVTANLAWQASYQNPMATAYQTWQSAGRSPEKLLRGAQLAEAAIYALAHPNDVTAEERQFLEQSQQQDTLKQEQARQAAARRRNLVMATIGVMLVLVGLSIWALQNAAEARTQKATAEAAAVSAVNAQTTAEARRVEAESAQAQAEKQARLANSRELAAAAIGNLATDPELSILLARQAISATYTAQAEDALHQAIQASRVQLRINGHSGALNRVTLSPDGKRLATAGVDGIAKVWDAVTGRALLTIPGHKVAINDVAFSPNGKWLATAGDDGYTRLWDVSTANSAEELHDFKGHNAQVKSVVFSPDGKQLATSGYDATIRLWSLAAITFGLSSRTISETKDAPITYALAFSPDGKRLAAGRADGTLVIWDVVSSKQLLSFRADESAIFGVAFSPSGAQLATGAFHGAEIWDSATGEVIHELAGHTAAVRAVAFSADGLHVATASEDQRVKVWNVASGQEELTLSGHKGSVYSVAFTPDAKRLATASADGTARVWNVGPSQELITLFDPVEEISDLAFAPDGRHLTTLGEDGMLKRWDLATGQVVVSYTVNSPKQHGNDGFSADGRRLAIGDQVEPPSVWDLEAAGAGHRLLTLSVPISQVYHAVALNFAGTKLATSSADKPIAIKVWDTATGKLLLTLIGHNDVVHAIDFSRDGRYIASASSDRSTRVWDALTGGAVLTLTGHNGEVWDVAFSPDGKHLATASYDGTAKIWDISTSLKASAVAGRAIRTLTGHTARVASVVFSPDGAWLVTTSGDKTAKLWNISPTLTANATLGENLLTLAGHTAEVRAAVFSRNGLHLATLGSDQTVRLYTLDRAELLALAQRRVTRTLTIEECQRYLHQKSCG